MPPDPNADAPVPLPITGELDLHTFRPSDLGELLPAYFAECAAKGIREVRVIHGKGTGALRKAVRSVLSDHPLVESFRDGSPAEGGNGATVAEMKVS